MSLHYIRTEGVAPFDYGFGGNIRARMADVGRALGSQSIGLTIQTVSPGCRSSRRHGHLFQEEILIVMAGAGTLLHGDERVPVGREIVSAIGQTIRRFTRSRTLAPRNW